MKSKKRYSYKKLNKKEEWYGTVGRYKDNMSKQCIDLPYFTARPLYNTIAKQDRIIRLLCLKLDLKYEDVVNKYKISELMELLIKM